jgi:hypothetical protein
MPTVAQILGHSQISMTQKYTHPIDGHVRTAMNNPVLPWARVGIKDNLRDQSSLGNQGNRRFESQGVVIVELYTPDGDGRFLDTTLTATLRNAFESVNVGDLWFRRARSEPVGPDRFWWHTNVIAEFLWVEVR